MSIINTENKAAEAVSEDNEERRFSRPSVKKKKLSRHYNDSDFEIDYKDVKLMQSFVTEHGQIVPRRITNLTAKDQRKLTIAIKRARQLALVGYTSPGW